ncbi:Hypothetical predicted protein, partial [Paramuricea clavata]
MTHGRFGHNGKQETASVIGSNDEDADGYNTESDEDSQDAKEYTGNTNCDQDGTENVEMDEREERQNKYSISNVESSPIGGKHHLTPSSKQDVLPKLKRFNVGGKPCGGEVAERKEQLEILFKETFQLQEGFEITVENVLSCLGFEPDKKKLLTRHVKEFFP